ncbi:hypothetical protein CFIMG_005689RA [Ceratocystis fimbriata CBS 114723]|uniref:Single-stranded DNA-binding protein n=1 Tax=Ceratocystis fimbriata CBS 114723 TaxID=1035309 RepID=A0A2C5WYV9_9PEZI|nr:hypothetical protein CFIMG_005689RA [Ceratocystis fimbriata CBS 114723]
MSSFIARRTVVSSASAARAFSTSSSMKIARMSIIGHLTATPEVLPTSKPELEVLRYSVACSSGKDKPASFFRITSFLKGDEYSSKKRDFMLGLPKGCMVYVEGDASMSSYNDEASGKTISSLNIVQRNIEILKRPKAEGADESQQ